MKIDISTWREFRIGDLFDLQTGKVMSSDLETNAQYRPEWKVEEMMKKYDVKNLKDGFNTVNGEEVFYISNPALGLWAVRDKFYSK